MFNIIPDCYFACYQMIVYGNSDDDDNDAAFILLVIAVVYTYSLMQHHDQ